MRQLINVNHSGILAREPRNMSFRRWRGGGDISLNSSALPGDAFTDNQGRWLILLMQLQSPKLLLESTFVIARLLSCVRHSSWEIRCLSAWMPRRVCSCFRSPIFDGASLPLHKPNTFLYFSLCGSLTSSKSKCLSFCSFISSRGRCSTSVFRRSKCLEIIEISS